MAEKIKRDRLSQIKVGSNFGQFLYKCPSCFQCWEENLSLASNKDWPPILIKLDSKQIKENYK